MNVRRQLDTGGPIVGEEERDTMAADDWRDGFRRLWTDRGRTPPKNLKIPRNPTNQPNSPEAVMACVIIEAATRQKKNEEWAQAVARGLDSLDLWNAFRNLLPSYKWTLPQGADIATFFLEGVDTLVDQGILEYTPTVEWSEARKDIPETPTHPGNQQFRVKLVHDQSQVDQREESEECAD